MFLYVMHTVHVLTVYVSCNIWTLWYAINDIYQ